jgi:hypothetical protein
MMKYNPAARNGHAPAAPLNQQPRRKQRDIDPDV